jgi:hypothetical protein
MRVVLNAAGGLVALLVAGCAASEAQRGTPALLVDPSAQTRDELARAVAAQFGGTPIPLAGDALTRTPELVLERAALRDPAGTLANGREPGRPELFHLLLIDGKCVLVRERTGNHTTLSTARCRAP